MFIGNGALGRRDALALMMAAVGGALSRPAFAADAFHPALAFDAGGAEDHGFNQAAIVGADRFKAETGIDYLKADVGDGAREAGLRDLAGRGATSIVAVGFVFADALKTAAAEFPRVQFTLIDALASGPNIQSVTMREQEGTFLVGTLAALASKTGKIGFIGGQNVPLIQKFAAGYKLGALRVDPRLTVLEAYIGTDATAWRNPQQAAALASRMFDEGADVIFAAAGGSGIGVYETAHQRGRLAIGVDANQNGLFPGTMLTSMEKRVDVVVYRTFKAAETGTWSPGALSLGLANGAVGWALDENNRPLVTAAMEKRVNLLAQDVVSGRIRVSDYGAR